MNWLLIKKELKDKKLSLIIFCLTGAALVWLYISLFPSLSKQASDIQKLVESLPKDFMKAFGAEGYNVQSVESLLSFEFYGLLWPILLIIFLLSRSANSIAGEIEKGTIGTLLSQPLSRIKIYLSKYTASVISLVIFIATTVLINIPLISVYGLEYSLKYQLVFAAICLLFGLSVLGLSFAISSVVNEKSKVYSIVGGLNILMFILNLISGLRENLSGLRYMSVFYYFNAQNILVKNEINAISVILFFCMAISGFIFGLYYFNKRDIRA